MKSITAWSRLTLAALVLFAGSASAQLFGVNPFDNTNATPPQSFGLFYLDPTTGAITDGRVITMAGRTIRSANGLAQDPTTGRIYVIARDDATNERVLATLNLSSGLATEIGPLGDSFASIAFRGDGQLFGVTGDGAATPETLFTINKATAATAVATALGNGADGEVIAYHPGTNSFYHWSGNGTVVFERVLAQAPFTVTPIAITGSTVGEIFGAVWDPTRARFLVHNISSSMDQWTIGGVRSNAQPPTLESVRGMVLFAVADGLAAPTLGEWSLILLAALMAMAALLAMRRQRRGGAPG